MAETDDRGYIYVADRADTGLHILELTGEARAIAGETEAKRLEAVAKVVRVGRQIAAAFEFVDIAGLVKGASKGEGLGNKFLSHIREVDALVSRALVRPPPCQLRMPNLA